MQKPNLVLRVEGKRGLLRVGDVAASLPSLGGAELAIVLCLLRQESRTLKVSVLHERIWHGGTNPPLRSTIDALRGKGFLLNNPLELSHHTLITLLGHRDGTLSLEGEAAHNVALVVLVSDKTRPPEPDREKKVVLYRRQLQAATDAYTADNIKLAFDIMSRPYMHHGNLQNNKSIREQLPAYLVQVSAVLRHRDDAPEARRVAHLAAGQAFKLGQHGVLVEALAAKAMACAQERRTKESIDVAIEARKYIMNDESIRATPRGLHALMTAAGAVMIPNESWIDTALKHVEVEIGRLAPQYRAEEGALIATLTARKQQQLLRNGNFDGVARVFQERAGAHDPENELFGFWPIQYRLEAGRWVGDDPTRLREMFNMAWKYYREAGYINRSRMLAGLLTDLTTRFPVDSIATAELVDTLREVHKEENQVCFLGQGACKGRHANPAQLFRCLNDHFIRVDLGPVLSRLSHPE